MNFHSISLRIFLQKMQSALRSKLAELQKQRTSPRKRTAKELDKTECTSSVYHPPHKRRGELKQDDDGKQLSMSSPTGDNKVKYFKK